MASRTNGQSSSSSRKPRYDRIDNALQGLKLSDTNGTPRGDRLDSAMMRDQTQTPKVKTEARRRDRLESAMFRDDVRTWMTDEALVQSEKVRHEKAQDNKRAKSVREEHESYTEEPDFSDFKSHYIAPGIESQVKKEDSDEEQSNSEVESYSPASRRARSRSPSPVNFKTAFTSKRDIKMAQKQTKISKLRGEELKEQEEWAKEKLRDHAGTCPMGFSWYRYTEPACGDQEEYEGYRCQGGQHLVTREMVARGKGEVLVKERIRHCPKYEGSKHEIRGVKWRKDTLESQARLHKYGWNSDSD
ncbi:hypothetical protein VTL71DRAFT_31 [Oculimacula yallundae]|uniref:Uncharacterized protein n=1 Tax=Oculimacula yallundae TaxID=86028 RepID=A0ABR4CYU8_9HELO